MGGTGRRETAARYFCADRLKARRRRRSARPARTHGRGCGIGRDAADHRACGIAAAGAGAVADVAGIPEEMTAMETTIGCCEDMRSSAISRRGVLLGGASFAAWAYLPKFARAADGRDPRLVVVILRGALDGLATVAPIGDPDYAGLHGSIALTSSGPNAAFPLDSFFALHPAMPEFARMYREKKAAVIHAVASALKQGLALDKAAQGDDMKPKPGTNGVAAMRLVARGAAKLMAADDGPRIGALAFDGWDTHANEGGPVGRLAQLLGGLDGALAEFETGLGPRWRDTVIVVATEFGRTARINGTQGTDHGTGTIALLAGGAVKGGRVS